MDQQAGKQITLKMRDSQDNDIDFRVKPSTKFCKVAKAYADKRHIDVNAIRFLRDDGERLQATEDKTVEHLGLADGDTIDVQLNQVSARGFYDGRYGAIVAFFHGKRTAREVSARLQRLGLPESTVVSHPNEATAHAPTPVACASQFQCEGFSQACLAQNIELLETDPMEGESELMERYRMAFDSAAKQSADSPQFVRIYRYLEACCRYDNGAQARNLTSSLTRQDYTLLGQVVGKLVQDITQTGAIARSHGRALQRKLVLYQSHANGDGKGADFESRWTAFANERCRSVANPFSLVGATLHVVTNADNHQTAPKRPAAQSSSEPRPKRSRKKTK
ncbi:hypothetical protein RI367_000963 [Sorochytrium milnesiophthora]